MRCGVGPWRPSAVPCWAKVRGQRIGVGGSALPAWIRGSAAGFVLYTMITFEPIESVLGTQQQQSTTVWLLGLPQGVPGDTPSGWRRLGGCALIWWAFSRKFEKNQASEKIRTANLLRLGTRLV